ncbi:uncharacterized protein [Euphorbia lathyris]|uniref:uncharacterized protein isoform X2 n=1 Tax=Euphorbia lathyris TaxID=212925 RepID=UPI00331331BE
MNLLKIHGSQSQIPPHFKFSSSPSIPYGLRFPLTTSNPFSSPTSLPLSPFRHAFTISTLSKTEASFSDNKEHQLQHDDDAENTTEFEYLAQDGVVFQNTLRLVECAMLAAVTGLIYFLSNSLSIEVATAMLLFVLSGPLKALIYLLTHGIVGFTMGSLWRLGADWRLSIFVCTIARAIGAMGYVFTSSFLIRENILALITVNIHASLTLIFAALGINIIPTMNVIYTLFGILVFLNSGFFVFLLHILYSVLLARLGMKDSLRLPGWLEKAL